VAVARAGAGRADEARDAARRALETDPGEDAAARARSVLDGAVAPREGPVRIGLLAPRSGRFAPVGERLREGVELAVEAHGEGLPPVEVTTLDTGEDGAEIPGLVRRLEEQGVVAVIGPVRSGELARAAGARSDPGLLLLSPTAGAAGGDVPGVYTLRGEVRDEVRAARALGRWLSGVVGSAPVGAVYPASGAGRRAYLAFRAMLGTGEAWIASAHPHDPDATTLEGPITAVSAFAPRAVFAPGASGSSVLQMAPQLSYYGVRGAIVAGGPAWSRPATVRRLEPSFSQHRVVATYVDRGAGSGGWERFRRAYEREHRRAVPGNMLPALAHDAALVVLRALRDVRPARPRAVARRAASTSPVEGATGRLRLDPGTGSAERRVRVRALRDRELVPAPASEAREWLRSAGGLETPRTRSRRTRAVQAVRASGIELEPPDDGGG
jgi:branched-chain amino acid transport system substrate-binding protein